MISVSIVIEADENRKVVQSYILSLISFSDPDHELQLLVKCSKWAESEVQLLATSRDVCKVAVQSCSNRKCISK